jgi:hypothetical protein
MTPRANDGTPASRSPDIHRDRNPHAVPHPHPHNPPHPSHAPTTTSTSSPSGTPPRMSLSTRCAGWTAGTARTPPSAHINPRRQLPCLTPTAALSHSPASPPLPRSRFPPHPSDHKVTGLPHQAKGLGHGWVLEQRGHRGEAATCTIHVPVLKASQPLPLRTRTHIIGTANGHVPKHSGQSPHWFTLGDSLHWGSL